MRRRASRGTTRHPASEPIVRLLCFVDNLGAGGAQRQLCSLAVLLQCEGLDVSMLTYHAAGFFAEALDRAGIPRLVAGGSGGLKRVLAVRRAIASARPDVVLAFLPMPCLYAEIAGAFGRRWGLIVGERSTTPDAGSPRARFLRQMHRLADAVVTNSHANRRLIEQSVPALRGRVSTIYNVVDLERFAATPLPPRDGPLCVVIAANYRAVKNPAGWVEAARIIRERRGPGVVTTDWYGGGAYFDSGKDERQATQMLVDRYGLRDDVRLHEACPDIQTRYRAAHVVALPSLFEGLPNTVCEAMACARPAASSAVSDAALLIREGSGGTGVLFDPRDPHDIATKVLELADLPEDRLRIMGQRARDRAEELFAPGQVSGAYHRLATACLGPTRPDPVFWPSTGMARPG